MNQALKVLQPSLPLLWCVNIHGPDDIIAVPSYIEAVKQANRFNVWWQECRTAKPLHEQFDARMWAVPIEWPYDGAGHAEALKEPSEEYAWLSNPHVHEAYDEAAARATQERT